MIIYSLWNKNNILSFEWKPKSIFVVISVKNSVMYLSDKINLLNYYIVFSSIKISISSVFSNN